MLSGLLQVRHGPSIPCAECESERAASLLAATLSVNSQRATLVVVATTIVGFLLLQSHDVYTGGC